MKKKIALLSGDGIGPEVINQAVKALKAVAVRYGHQFQFQSALVGAAAIRETGDPLPNETLSICRDADAILFGAIGDPAFDQDPSAKVRPEQGLLRLRKEMGLFANIRPVELYESLSDRSPLRKDRIKGTDLVVYRELTGGIYFGEKGRSSDGKLAYDACEYSVEEIERITMMALEAALRRRKKCTLVDKSNVLETSRLWRETVQRLAKKYPQVEMEYLYVDNAAMQLIQRPAQFDVILTENMFGDILSDEASVLTGSLGLLPSASVGEKTALFEPVHGSYPEAAGKDIANPIAAILSAAMMLDHFGMFEEAERIQTVVRVLMDNDVVTMDLNPNSFVSCSKIGDVVGALIESDSEDEASFANLFEGGMPIV